MDVRGSTPAGGFHYPVLSKFNILLAGAVYDTESFYLFDGELNADGSSRRPSAKRYTPDS